MISVKQFTRKIVVGTTLMVLAFVVGMLIWTRRGEPYGETARKPHSIGGSVFPAREDVESIPETDRNPVSPTRVATSGTSRPVAFVDKTKLSSAERLKVDQTLTRIIAQFRSELWEKGADLPDAAAAAAEADWQYQIATQEAVLFALRKDDFVLLPLGESLGVSRRDALVTSTSVTVAGEKMKMWFALMYDEHPELVAGEKYWMDVAALAGEEAIRLFNDKPLAERKRLFEENAAWRARRDALDGAFEEARKAGRDPWKDGELIERQRTIGLPPLPQHGGKDTVSYLLSPWRRRR